MPKTWVDRGTDWARGDALSDATIEHMAREDRDNPATTVEDWADAVIGFPAELRGVFASEAKQSRATAQASEKEPPAPGSRRFARDDG